jgi:indolepyruvate ferredoxin oxidoreductase beta subunit
MNEETISIVLVGVGGQGILLASAILAQAALHAGFQVKTNEVHGMAQRGGSVTAQIRYGQEVYSPLVEEGTARVLAAFEPIEAVRMAHYLAPDGFAVVSSEIIVPVTVSSGAAQYPTDVEGLVRDVFPQVLYFDAARLAADAGNVRTANVVILGALSSQVNLPPEAWREAMTACVKPRFLDVNLRAFAAGRQAAELQMAG